MSCHFGKLLFVHVFDECLYSDVGGAEAVGLPHRVLMSRVLGLPGCDYKADPFRRHGGQWKPSREDLKAEYQRRNRFFGHTRPSIPKPQPRKEDFDGGCATIQ